MDGTGSGSRPMAGFGISGVEPSDYGTGVRSRGKWERSV
jgi:hypothetical protein